MMYQTPTFAVCVRCTEPH